MSMRALWCCLGLCGLAAFTRGNLNLAYPPVDAMVTWPPGCRRLGGKRSVSSHASQPAVPEPWFHPGSSDLWLPLLIVVFHHSKSLSDCWALIFLQSEFSTVAGLQPGSPGRHACSEEAWKEEKFVMRLFDFHATVTRCSLSVRGMIIWATIKSNQCQMASDWHAGGTQALKSSAEKKS